MLFLNGQLSKCSKVSVDSNISGCVIQKLSKMSPDYQLSLITYPTFKMSSDLKMVNMCSRVSVDSNVLVLVFIVTSLRTW